MVRVEYERNRLCSERKYREGASYGRVVFFFQAEDGIRAYKVTGVQTCALPISPQNRPQPDELRRCNHYLAGEIGRASCRERVSISVVAGSLKKKERPRLAQ